VPPLTQEWQVHREFEVSTQVVCNVLPLRSEVKVTRPACLCVILGLITQEYSHGLRKFPFCLLDPYSTLRLPFEINSSKSRMLNVICKFKFLLSYICVKPEKVLQQYYICNV